MSCVYMATCFFSATLGALLSGLSIRISSFGDVCCRISCRSSVRAYEPERMALVSCLRQIPSFFRKSILACSKAFCMARRDSDFISELPFSKLLIAVLDRPLALARSCCVQFNKPRAARHWGIEIMSVLRSLVISIVRVWF